jgi:hypothetical protein
MMINIESATQLWFLGHTSLKKAAPEAAAKLATDPPQIGVANPFIFQFSFENAR